MSAPAPVTVAVPVYNGANFLARALASLCAQTYTDFEVIIRDNASTDATEEIARAFVSADSRFRYVRNEKNVGGARNCNALLADASSPYIVWAFHDDERHPRFLSDAVARLEEAGPEAVVAYPRVQLIDAGGTVVGRHEDADLDVVQDTPHERLALVLRRVVAQVQFGLMRTEAVRSAGGFSPEFAGEFVLPAAMALRGKLLLSCRDEPRLSIREHGSRHGGNRGSEVAWVNPDRPHVPFPYSRTTPLILRAVAGAALPRNERVRCCQAVLWNWTAPHARSIVGDVVNLPRDLGWFDRRVTAATTEAA